MQLFENFKNIVYIAHPYGGQAINEIKVQNLIRDLSKQYPNYLFINGITSFGFLYSDVDYKKGLDMTLWLLNKCDECWVFGDWESSKGCIAEIQFCKENNIPYKIMN